MPSRAAIGDHGEAGAIQRVKQFRSVGRPDQWHSGRKLDRIVLGKCLHQRRVVPDLGCRAAKSVFVKISAAHPQPHRPRRLQPALHLMQHGRRVLRRVRQACGQLDVQQVADLVPILDPGHFGRRLLLAQRTLRRPNVGCTSGIGGICQVPVIGMPVSRLMRTSSSVGVLERIASA